MFRQAVALVKDANGGMSLAPIAMRDHAAGNTQFLEELPIATCALRPALASELPEGAYTARSMMLVCTDAEGDIFYASVQMPPHRRRNNRRNVRYAIAKTKRLSPHLGELLDALDRGCPLADGERA